MTIISRLCRAVSGKNVKLELLNSYASLESPGTYRMSTTLTGNESPISGEVKPFNEMPCPKGLADLPYIGTMFLFKPFSKYTPHEIDLVVKVMSKQYGDIFKFRFGKGYMVILGHPEDAKTLMQANYEQHTRTTFDLNKITYERLKRKESLIMLNGQEWAERRKPVQEKMLRPAVVANYIPLIESVTDDFVERLGRKQVVDDLLWETTNYGTESVGMLGFNRRLGCLDSEKDNPAEVATCIRTILGSLQKSVFAVFKGYMLFRSPLYKRFEKATNTFYEFTKKEIAAQKDFLLQKEKEGKLEEYLQKEPNFMYSLLSDERINDEAANITISDLFFAGIDSTANSLVFVLAQLSLNPDIQRKLYDEIKNVMGDSKNLTKEHLAQMSYLKACFKETQRTIFPISLGVLRFIESDLVLGGFQVPKDTMVVLNNRLMCMDERFFPRPDQYLPERWVRGTTGELASHKDYPFSHKPFGFGARSCIGQRFAETEIFIAIAKIIQNFEVSMPPEVKEIKQTLNIFTAPVGEIKMTFTPRK